MATYELYSPDGTRLLYTGNQSKNIFLDGVGSASRKYYIDFEAYDVPYSFPILAHLGQDYYNAVYSLGANGYVGISRSKNAAYSDFEDGDKLSTATTPVKYYAVERTTAREITVTYNGSSIISDHVIPTVAVSYNGTQIASLSAGESKTLKCSGKLMASDLTIGTHTLACAGKVMASDIVVSVS